MPKNEISLPLGKYRHGIMKKMAERLNFSYLYENVEYLWAFTDYRKYEVQKNQRWIIE